MSTVYAGQHLYANVEQAQSPRGRSGFQTLFATYSALTAADVDDIEGRLVYHRGNSAPVKRLYFATTSGKQVVAQIVPLTDTDRLGRQGRYLAHSLVFTPEAFCQLGADPLHVLSQVSWCTTIEAALQCGDFQSGELPPVAVPLPPPSPTCHLASWPAQSLQQWFLLALRAHRLAQQRQAVVVVGTPEHMTDALATAYLVVPTALRPHCTFDTYFDHCNLVGTYYWAIGVSERPGHGLAPYLDAQTHDVLVSPPGQPETAYERWVMATLAQQGIDHIARHKDHAYAVCTWLEESASRPPDTAGLLDTVPPSVLDSVFAVHALHVQERLTRALGAHLHAHLVKRVQPAIHRDLSAVALFTHLRHGFTVSQLVETLYQVYVSAQGWAPRRAERRALSALLDHTEHHGLRLLHACWTGQQPALQQALAPLSVEAYGEFVAMAKRTGLVSPLALLIPGRGDAFVNAAVDAALLRRPGLLAIVRALLAAGEGNSLVHLAPYVAHGTPPEIRALAHLISTHTAIPARFGDAVHTMSQSLPPLRGVQAWLHMLRNTLRSEP